jgi:hypothetical protein
MDNYEGLHFNRRELSSAMEKCYKDIVDLITKASFQAVFAEMMAFSPAERPRFVMDVWLHSGELAKRSVHVPPGILIQTSAFGDRRPTLFVVKKYLPTKYHSAWENVNWTFNNEFGDEDVPSDPESSWRLPLRVSIQNAAIASNLDLQSLPTDGPEFLQSLDSAELIASEKRVRRVRLE